MKKLFLTVLSIGCFIGICSADALRSEQLSFLNNQRLVSKKDVHTIPGKILIYYTKGGKPDGVMTQDCFKVTSGRNKNPLLLKYINSTNLVNAVSNQLIAVKATIQSIKERNDEAIASLDELKTKAPLLSALIEKIKAKIKIDIESNANN